MNIYRPCVCLVLRKLHNICFANTDDSVFWRKKKHTSTQSLWWVKQRGSGWRFGSTPSVTSNTSLCWRTEPLHHHASALQGEEGRDVGVTTSLGSRPQQARTEEAAAVGQAANGPRESASLLLMLGNASIPTHVQVGPESRGSGLTQCCVTRQPRPSANQANSTFGNRSICVTLILIVLAH